MLLCTSIVFSLLKLSSCTRTHTQCGLHVNDLFIDLSDGRLLIRLLETISGEKIGSIGRGRLRINKIENVGKALHFLQEKKVSLTSPFLSLNTAGSWLVVLSPAVCCEGVMVACGSQPPTVAMYSNTVHC